MAAIGDKTHEEQVPVQEVEEVPIADETSKDQDADAYPHPFPMPSFSNATPYGEGIMVGCFWPGCLTKRSTCLSLMTHLKQSHTKLKAPPEWKDTYFAQTAKDEKLKQQQGRRNKMPIEDRRQQRKKKPIETKTEAAKADEKGGTAQSVFISMPGASFKSRVLVPKSVCDELLAAGFIQFLKHFECHWNPVIPLPMQEAQLLELLPEGPQKRALEQKFGAVYAHPVHLQTQALVAPSLPRMGETQAGMDLRVILAELKHMIACQASGAPCAELQKLEVCKKFVDWQKPADWDGRLRKNFPFHELVINDTDFDKFMTVRRLKQRSRTMYMKAARPLW